MNKTDFEVQIFVMLSEAKHRQNGDPSALPQDVIGNFVAKNLLQPLNVCAIFYLSLRTPGTFFVNYH